MRLRITSSINVPGRWALGRWALGRWTLGRWTVNLAVLIAVALLASGVTGCASGKYRCAKDLPRELLAPAVTNAQTVELSNFAGPPVNSEMIDWGDVLEVSIAAGLSADDVTTFMVRVGDGGRAMLPEIGELQLAGLHLMEAEQQITAACVSRGIFRQPQVTVAMKRQRMNHVTVLGAVPEAGVYELPRRSSYLMAALVAAGGLAEDAGTNVEIRQPAGPRALAAPGPGFPGPPGVHPASNTTPVSGDGFVRVCLNLADEINQGVGGRYLEDGAVVTVERLQPEKIEVIGLVKKPGRYELPVNHELRLLGAIAEAGGLSIDMADKVLLVRKHPNGQGPVSITLSLRKAKLDGLENLQLAPGDIVSVERTPATIISDTLSKFIRFGMSATIPTF